MPVYEYLCLSCQHPFEALIMGSESASCPNCHGEKLEKQLSAFAVGERRPAGGGRAPSASMPALGACGQCGDPSGPGACQAS